MRAEDTVALATPPWVEMERRSLVGYWLPPLLLAVLLYAVSFASTWQRLRLAGLGTPGARLRETGILQQRSQPLVRLRGLVWRRYPQGNGVHGTITLQGLVIGPPVGRIWATWTPPKKQATAAQRAADWWASFKKFMVGVPLKDLGLTVVKLPPRK